MKKYEHSTHVEVGDCYEFCVVIDNVSNVKYGKVITLNYEDETFDFECLSNGIDKKPTGEIHKDVLAVRGIGYVHDDTWMIDGKIHGIDPDFDRDYEIERIATCKTEAAEVSELEDVYYETRIERLERLSDKELYELSKDFE